MSTAISILIRQKTLTVRTPHILLVLLVAGTVIRFQGLTYSSLWLDEIYSMIGSNPATTLSDVYQYSIGDQPPLFFILLHGWLKLFGYSDFAGRALTCTFGVSGILAMYFLGNQVKDEKLGLFAAFITTINWFHTDISKEIRFYPLVFLLTALSFLFYLRAVKKSGITDFILYAIFTALLLNTHYYGIVVFVSQLIIFVIILIFFKRNLHLLIGGLAAGCIAGLSIWHWLPVITSDLQISSFHVKPVTLWFPFTFLWDYIKDPVAFGVYSFCIFLAAYAFCKTLKEKRFSVEHLIVLGWISLSFLIPLLYSLFRVPLLTYKYATISVPAIFLVISYGFTHINYERLRFYSILLIICSGFIMLFIARPPYKPRTSEDWREVAAYFANDSSNSKIIFSQLAWFHTYYFTKYKHALPIDQNNCNFDDIVKKTGQVWLMKNDRYTGGWSINGLLPDQQQKINQEFNLIDSVKFKQTTAYLYTRKK